MARSQEGATQEIVLLLDCEVLGALGMCGKDRRGRGREPHQDKVAG